MLWIAQMRGRTTEKEWISVLSGLNVDLPRLFVTMHIQLMKRGMTHLFHEVRGWDKPQPPRSPLGVQSARRCPHAFGVATIGSKWNCLLTLQSDSSGDELPSILRETRAFTTTPRTSYCACALATSLIGKKIAAPTHASQIKLCKLTFLCNRPSLHIRPPMLPVKTRLVYSFRRREKKEKKK